MEIASKVFTLGNSNAIRIPHVVMEALRLQAEDPITLEVRESGELIVRKQTDSEPYPSIRELFAGYTAQERPAELDGGVTGRELI